MRRSERRSESAEEAVLELVQQHAAELLRFARRFSHCADDAHDAYQRTLEILVRRMRTDPPAHPLSWVRTVLRNEALTLRAEREQLVGRVEVDLDRHEARELADPADRAIGHERVRHTAEALRRLKPQELTALVLRAEGLTYREICARTGWTYTRCNRAITEGRRALVERLGAIESGAECARWLPLLSVLADGEATAAELSELRPHLRACPACRSTLRGFHAAPADVAALVPPALLPLATVPRGSLLHHVEGALHALAERGMLLATRVQGTIDAVPSAKLAAVAASTAALAGGGVAIQHVTDAHRAPGAAAHAASATPPPVRAGSLLPIAFPLPPAAAASPVRGTRRPQRHSEFAPPPSASAPEFAPRAAPTAEFAAVTASRGTGAAATATSSARSPVPHGTAPPEFASP